MERPQANRSDLPQPSFKPHEIMAVQAALQKERSAKPAPEANIEMQKNLEAQQNAANRGGETMIAAARGAELKALSAKAKLEGQAKADALSAQLKERYKIRV